MLRAFSIFNNSIDQVKKSTSSEEGAVEKKYQPQKIFQPNLTVFPEDQRKLASNELMMEFGWEMSLLIPDFTEDKIDKNYYQKFIQCALNLWPDAKNDTLEQQDAFQILQRAFIILSNESIAPTVEQLSKLWNMTDLARKGLCLRKFVFILLSIGEANTFDPTQEPRPGDVIDLIYKHVHQDIYGLFKNDLKMELINVFSKIAMPDGVVDIVLGYIQGVLFASSAFYSKRERIQHAIDSREPILSLTTGGQALSNGIKLRSRLGFEVVICPRDCAPDKRFQLIGVDSNKSAATFVKPNLQPSHPYHQVCESHDDLLFLKDFVEDVAAPLLHFYSDPLFPPIEMELRLKATFKPKFKRMNQAVITQNNLQRGLQESTALIGFRKK